MNDHEVAALVAVLLMAVVHVLPPHLRFVRLVPRSRILSAAGGVSVAYVFIHLLPEVAAAQEAVDEMASGAMAAIERHAYVTALVGLAVFYGLERAAIRSRVDRDHDPETPGRETGTGAFWLSITSFAVYNGLIGHLVVQRAEHGSTLDLALFAGALAVHFVVNDLALRDHHRRRYDRIGRPVLIAAVLCGWIVGIAVEVPEAALGLVTAFIGGGVILNVLKEELPEERESRFGAFAAGALGYTLLLLLV